MSKASISGAAPHATSVKRTGRLAALSIAAVVAIAALFPLFPAGGAPGVGGAAGTPGDEACLVSRINGSRQAEGLPALAVHSALVSIARRHSQWMIDTLGPRTWQHNSNLPNELPNGWITRGENVGWATDCDHMQNFFINSPPHRKNMLNPAFNHVGVGVLIDAQGDLRVTEVFMQTGGGTAPAPAPKPQASATPVPTPAPVKATPPKIATAPKVPASTPTPAGSAKNVGTPKVAVRTRAIQDILKSEPQAGGMEVYFEVIAATPNKK